MKEGSQGYLYGVVKCIALMYEDDGSSLSSLQELRVIVCFIFKEMEEVILEVFSMMRWNGLVFLCLTDDMGRCLTEYTEGGQVRVGECE